MLKDLETLGLQEVLLLHQNGADSDALPSEARSPLGCGFRTRASDWFKWAARFQCRHRRWEGQVAYKIKTTSPKDFTIKLGAQVACGCRRMAKGNMSRQPKARVWLYSDGRVSRRAAWLKLMQSYCGWTKSYHLGSPGMMTPMKLPTNIGFPWFQRGAGFCPSTGARIMRRFRLCFGPSFGLCAPLHCCMPWGHAWHVTLTRPGDAEMMAAR